MPLDAPSLVAIAVALVLAGGVLAWSALPRLRVSASLRGSTRHGTLYVQIENRAARVARRVQLEASWRAADGSEARIDGTDVGDINGHDAIAVTIRDLQRGLDTARAWDAIVVRVRARGVAWPARPARVELAKRAGAGAGAERQDAAPPVRYERERACVSPDGAHWFQEHELPNDGVREHWRVCRRCGLAMRAPLSPADEATQRRVRAERAAREQRKLEEELARSASCDAPPPSARRPPPLEEGELPIEVARWILGIESTAPTLAQVEEAFKRLAKEHHPDKLPADAEPAARRVMEERMRDLNVARETLRRHLREAQPP